KSQRSQPRHTICSTCCNVPELHGESMHRRLGPAVVSKGHSELEAPGWRNGKAQTQDYIPAAPLLEEAHNRIHRSPRRKRDGSAGTLAAQSRAGPRAWKQANGVLVGSAYRVYFRAREFGSPDLRGDCSDPYSDGWRDQLVH